MKRKVKPSRVFALIMLAVCLICTAAAGILAIPMGRATAGSAAGLLAVIAAFAGVIPLIRGIEKPDTRNSQDKNDYTE